MTHPQLTLAGSKAKREHVDETLIRSCLDGGTDLKRALGVTPEICEGLRRQAHALCTAGKWQACIDVIGALAALGDVDPTDPLILGLAHQALGNPESAESCIALAGEILEAMDFAIRKGEGR